MPPRLKLTTSPRETALPQRRERQLRVVFDRCPCPADRRVSEVDLTPRKRTTAMWWSAAFLRLQASTGSRPGAALDRRRSNKHFVQFADTCYRVVEQQGVKGRTRAAREQADCSIPQRSFLARPWTRAIATTHWSMHTRAIESRLALPCQRRSTGAGREVNMSLASCGLLTRSGRPRLLELIQHQLARSRSCNTSSPS
jgi:hypothetical protein